MKNVLREEQQAMSMVRALEGNKVGPRPLWMPTSVAISSAVDAALDTTSSAVVGVASAMNSSAVDAASDTFVVLSPCSCSAVLSRRALFAKAPKKTSRIVGERAARVVEGDEEVDAAGSDERDVEIVQEVCRSRDCSDTRLRR